jgi:hypothetical protein
VFKRKINDPIADLRRAVAELRPGRSDLGPAAQPRLLKQERHGAVLWLNQT